MRDAQRNIPIRERRIPALQGAWSPGMPHRRATPRGGEELVLVHFQIRRSLRSGAPVGCEAHIRWPHRRMLTQARGLDMAPGMGLATGLGGWALRLACERAARWPEGLVCVPVAACQIRDGALIGQIVQALDRSGLAPERLQLLLDETALVELGCPGSAARLPTPRPAHGPGRSSLRAVEFSPGDADPRDDDAILCLSALRDLGIGIAVDDFGGGIGSLTSLRQLPLTAVKLGRTLVRGIAAADEAAILAAIIAAGRALDLTVIADGVELEAQVSFLLANGCDEAQGPLFGLMPADPPGANPA